MKKAGLEPAFFRFCCFVASLPTRLAALTPTAAVATSAASSAATTTTKIAFGSRPCFINIDGAAVQFYTVELFDSRSCSILIHFDKRKAAGAAGVSVGHDRCRFPLPRL